eukprot:SAG22_NODE_17321_length_307_cov_0.740385_1_plen_41_part_01
MLANAAATSSGRGGPSALPPTVIEDLIVRKFFERDDNDARV